jgi:hypothetical protein
MSALPFAALAFTHHFEFDRLLDRQIGELHTVKNVIDIGCGAMPFVIGIGRIGKQATSSWKMARATR